MPFLPFVALDVETANFDCTNICQFGYAAFLDGALHAKNAFLINPECDFEPRFKAIHGITADMVIGSPTWPLFHPTIVDYLNAAIVLSHTYFDKEAIGKACTRYHLPLPMPKSWVDTCSLARRVWPNIENHKLPMLAKCFAITYHAHDAAEDARCAGEIFLLAVRDSGQTMEQIIKKYAMWWPATEPISTRPKTIRPPAPEYRPTAELKRAKYARLAAERVAALTPDVQLDIQHMWPPQNVQLEPPAPSVPAPPELPEVVEAASGRRATVSARQSRTVSRIPLWAWALGILVLLVILAHL